MSNYQKFMLLALPGTLIAVTVIWLIEKDTNKGITWGEMWMNMWEAQS